MLSLKKFFGKKKKASSDEVPKSKEGMESMSSHFSHESSGSHSHSHDHSNHSSSHSSGHNHEDGHVHEFVSFVGTPPGKSKAGLNDSNSVSETTKSKKTKNDSLKNPVSKKKSSKKEPAITRQTMIGEAAELFPGASEILLSYGIHCVGCGMNAYETIEQGLTGHGMPDEIIQQLIDELNEAFEDYIKKQGSA